MTADPAFAELARSTFGASEQIALRLIAGTLAAVEAEIDAQTATVAVIDLDAASAEDMQALERLMAREGAALPVVAVTRSVDANLARTLLQMRVADFLVKPVSPVELVRTCARVANAPAATAATEAQIYTFLPTAGGGGVTTLAIQSALILLNSGARGKILDLPGRSRFPARRLRRLSGHRAAAQPRRDRAASGSSRPPAARGHAVAPRAPGLAVIAAPHHLAEMRSFDPDVVTRLLDLVSTNFDYVVFDMPRTWFSWTDSVLLGSNQSVRRLRGDGAGPAPCQAPGRGRA